MPSDFNITIEHCNSVERADVKITPRSLNIKYGSNGLGKSTIAKAIVSQIKADGSLEELTPFKDRGKAGAIPPSVQGVETLNSALVFDEAYVNQFVFQQQEVIKNSFDIFIRTPEYYAAMDEIDDLLDGIRSEFVANKSIEQILGDLRLLREAFGTSKTGSIPKNSKIHKAFGLGNKIENVPSALEPFNDFIKSAEPSKWIAWQIKGNDFLPLSQQCPYCASALPEGPQKETALAVAKEYDANAIGHLNLLKGVIERLGSYFSENCRDSIDGITSAKVELTAAEQGFLTQLKTSVDSLISMLEALSEISFFRLRDVDKLEVEIARLKIDMRLIDKLDSEGTRAVVDPINKQLDELVEKIGPLKGCINKHKSFIEKTILGNLTSINNFLKRAGYKYAVNMIPEADEYKMKLIHEDLSEHIESASKHLSYGEKNAFALVLFMHEVTSKKPDLVVLDDPISSFDKNKKFAILNELFTGKASLRDYTVLMLTHDIEPAIDVVRGVSRVFQGANPSATHLTCKGGHVTETPIAKADIQTFAQICRENIGRLADNLVKAIYLRRYYEIVDDLGLEYNLLASLFHKRSTPTLHELAGIRDMTLTEKADAEVKIKNYIPDFDYDSLVLETADEAKMQAKYDATTVGYEKIQLFRMMRDRHDDDVVTKFVNEAYHIENEFVMQLNPHKFESVPEYIVEACTKQLKKP